MSPHCLLFVHLGRCCWILIGCRLSLLLVELVVVLVVVVGGAQHIPGNTFRSAVAAWRGKAVKGARPPLCLPPLVYGSHIAAQPSALPGPQTLQLLGPGHLQTGRPLTRADLLQRLPVAE